MKLIKSTGYTDMVAESIYSTLEKELMLFAEVQGKSNGLDNKPLTEPEFKAFFLNKVESKIQVAVDSNQKIHLPVSGVVVAQKNENVANETVIPLSASLKDKELEFRTLEERKKECRPDLQKRRIRKWVYAGAAIIAIAEGFFAYGALRRIPLAWIPAFIASLGITIALAFGTHIMAGYIRKAKTRLQFLSRFFICVIPVFIGFFVLGQLRVNAYKTAAEMNLNVHQTTVSQHGASGMGITILSFLLFLAALIFSICYYKTDEEVQQDALYDKSCDELNQCEKKRNEIKSVIEKTKGAASAQSAEALQRYEYALSVENRLKSLAKQVVQEYILKNLCYRTDGITPLFFSNPPVLNFRLFFDNVKQKNHENA